MIPNYFLYLIYLCFVMYGWVASLLGGVWPKLSGDLGIDISMLGVLVMINYAASGISSLFTYKIRMKIGTCYTNVLALVCTVISMIVFATAPNFAVLAVAVLFLGFACGVIDINSNSYVVKAFDTKWVSFMHACWGFGATIGPMIMSFAMVYLPDFRYGFYITAVIILLVIVFLVFAKRYWEGKKKTLDKDFVSLHSVTKEEKGQETSLIDLLKVKNTLKIALCFFFANGAGCALSAWLATMAVGQRGANETQAAFAASAFFFSLMIGRIFFGMLASKCGIAFVFKLCTAMSIILSVCYYIPYKSVSIVFVHSALIGFASGSMIPLLNSNVKDLFEEKYLSQVIGFGGASGLVGIATMSALMTVVTNVLTIHHIQIIQIVCFTLIYILYSSAVKSNNS